MQWQITLGSCVHSDFQLTVCQSRQNGAIWDYSSNHTHLAGLRKQPEWWTIGSPSSFSELFMGLAIENWWQVCFSFCISMSLICSNFYWLFHPALSPLSLFYSHIITSYSHMLFFVLFKPGARQLCAPGFLELLLSTNVCMRMCVVFACVCVFVHPQGY